MSLTSSCTSTQEVMYRVMSGHILDIGISVAEADNFLSFQSFTAICEGSRSQHNILFGISYVPNQQIFHYLPSFPCRWFWWGVLLMYLLRIYYGFVVIGILEPRLLLVSVDGGLQHSHLRAGGSL